METSLEVSPWLVELREERCLPSSVTGPVEFFALARLAVICAGEAMSLSPFGACMEAVGRVRGGTCPRGER